MGHHSKVFEIYNLKIIGLSMRFRTSCQEVVKPFLKNPSGCNKFERRGGAWSGR